jgi:hypothetical protein
LNVRNGAELFMFPQRATTKGGVVRREVSAGRLAKLRTVQRQATIAITGAMRMMATDIMDFHAGLIPISDSVEQCC